MTTFAENIRSILIDSDKREVSIILREFPTVLLTAKNLSFGDPEFRFSLVYSGASEADCNVVADFIQPRAIEVGNLIRSVALPVFVGSETVLKTLLDASKPVTVQKDFDLAGSVPQE